MNKSKTKKNQMLERTGANGKFVKSVLRNGERVYGGKDF